MTAQEALQEVDRLNAEILHMAECWTVDPNKATFPQYERKIRNMFPKVLVEKVTQRPFGFILRAEDQRLQVKYLMHNPKVSRVDAFSEIGRAARKAAKK